MKKIIYILPLIAMVFAVACEESVPTWSGANRINFKTPLQAGYGNVNEPVLSDTIKYFTFAFESEETQKATVWIEVETQGFNYNYPRAFKIVPDNSYGITDAVAGKHYVDFEASEVKDQYVMPAETNTVNIPIVLIRDPELKTKSVSLRISFAENEYFTLGFADYRAHRTIVITDRLSKPSLWDNLSSYFGDYGTVKHQFMIDAAGEVIDDGYLQEILDTSDRDYYRYLAGWFQAKLDEENQKRKEANGGIDDPLMEEDGVTKVNFV